MSAPIVVPETFYNGPLGGTPLDADAMNRIWDGLMQGLLDQLTPRRVEIDTSISMGEMLLVDASNGPVHLQVSPASTTGSQGARKIDKTANPVYLTAVGADVLDEAGSTTLTLQSALDDVVLSYAGPGRFTVARRTTAPLPATPSTYGTIMLGAGGDLVGPASAITVPGKENAGVAQSLLTSHTSAADPHADRAYTRSYLGDQLTLHSRASDPHGDRAWAGNQFAPLSWFDGNGQLLPSHTGALSIISTSVVDGQPAMLALNAQQGDIAIRTDAASSGGKRTYILQGPDPTVLANWTVLPALGAVSSVRGSAGSAMTGDVVIGYADVGAAPANDSRITGAEQTSNKNVANGYAGLLANGSISQAMLPGASTTAYGIVRLSGDLGGTAASPTVLGKAPLFTPNPTVYTAAHTPILQEIAQYNAANGSFSNALPAAPSVGSTTVSVLEIKNLTPAASPNTVTFTPAGSDTIDYTTNPLVMRGYGEARRLVGYQGNWTVDMGLNTYTALDVRYLQIANYKPIPAGGTAGQTLVKTSAADYAMAWQTPSSSGTLVANPPLDQAFATSLTPNAQAGNYRTMTATADFTLNPPTNPADGQVWRLRFVASGAARTCTMTGFRMPVVNGNTMTTGLSVPSGRRGDIAAVYDAADGAWTILSAQAQAA